jgi:anti-sigma factor RsiW
MNAPPRPTEEELHAWLDGEMAEDRRAVVGAYLRDHPAEARRLEAYRADGEALARLFARAAEARVPQRASPALWRRRSWVRVAAIVVMMAGAVAAAVTWVWQGRRDDALWTRFGTEALAAHLALGRPDSPPQLAVSLQDVAQFFSAALNTPFELRTPADPSFTLVGSRFVSGAKGRVAQLAFRDAGGTLVTMYFEPWPGKKDAPFREVARQDDVATLVWVDDALGCAVTGALPPAQLERVGHALYAALVKS